MRAQTAQGMPGGYNRAVIAQPNTCVCIWLCVCPPAVCWGQLKLPVDVLHMARSKAARAVKNGAQHGQSMWARVPLFHTFCANSPPPPPSLWRVHQFVSQQILLFTYSYTQQQDPWLKLSEQEQRQGVGKEGGSGAAAVFTSGFSCAAALSIDHHSVTV